MKKSHRIVILTLSLFVGALQANTLEFSVLDQNQLPLADAVVELIPIAAVSQGKKTEVKTLDAASSAVDVAQKNRTFVPYVSAVSAGSYVDFPNFDKTRHHVYSFSKIKTFELKLYVGRPEAKILFEQPGIAAIGCNIHDYMQAYIYVGESPLLGVTDSQGKLQIHAVETGEYQVKLWHPWQQTSLAPYKINSSLKVHSYSIAVESRQKPSPPENEWQQLFKQAND